MARPASPAAQARSVWRQALTRRRRAAVASLLQGAWRYARDAGAVAPGSRSARRFAAFGPGSLIAFPPGAVFGEAWIAIGEATLIGPEVSLSAGLMPGHDLGDEPVLRLGDRCVIGRGSHLIAHHGIEIGDDVFTGPHVYITDQNHAYTDPDLPVGRQWPVNDAVSVGPGCWLGASSIVLPGARIGRNVVVAAGSVVRGKVPDHCVVAGVPARVVREYHPDRGWFRPDPT